MAWDKFQQSCWRTKNAAVKSLELLSILEQSNYSKLSHLPLALSLTKLSEEFQVMGFHFKSPILDLFHGFIVVLPPGSVTFFLFLVGGVVFIHSLTPEPLALVHTSPSHSHLSALFPSGRVR